MTEALHQSRGSAQRDVAAAAALAGSAAQLPEMGRALAEGQVSRDHVDVAVSALARIPAVLKTKAVPGPDGSGSDRTGAQVIDHVLTDQARHHPPTTIERLGRQIVHRLDPDRAEHFGADAVERRTCSISEDFTRMGHYRLTVDPVTHLHLKTVIAAAAAPRPASAAVDAEGVVHVVQDTRTIGQRQADAVTHLLLAGAGAHPLRAPAPATPESDPAEQPAEQPAGPDAPDVDAGPPGASAAPSVATEICVIATLDQFAAAHGAGDPAARTAGLARISLAGHTGPYPGATLHPAVLARLSCDSPIRRILVDDNGAILRHGRSRRLATTAQKRALAVRDGGCVIPGCPLPAEWCDAHHVIPWEIGGVTDVDAMVLLCPHHHTAHHAGIYDIRVTDGIPWVRVPLWIHPDRPWLHNTTHDHHHLADAIAHQLTGPPVAARHSPATSPADEPHETPRAGRDAPLPGCAAGRRVAS